VLRGRGPKTGRSGLGFAGCLGLPNQPSAAKKSNKNRYFYKLTTDDYILSDFWQNLLKVTGGCIALLGLIALLAF
jgi:hypothetical protein